MDAAGDRRDALRFLLVATALHVVTALMFMLDRAPGTSAAWGGLPLDDGWIHLVYARALATTGRFEYNPGQLEAGFTSPLWVVLVAPWFWLKSAVDVPVVQVVKWVGVALGVLASALTHRLARAVSGRRSVAWVAGLVVALDPLLAFSRVSGMEVTLAAATALLVLVAVIEERPTLTGVAMALAPIARPENLLLCALAGVVMALSLRRRSAPPRTWAAVFVPVVVTVAAWSLYCLHVIGRPLPTTFYAKHQAPSLLDHFDDVGEALRMLTNVPWLAWGSGVLVCAIGARAVVREGAADGRPARVLVAAYPWVFFAAMIWAHQVFDGNAFYWSRYLGPSIPFWAALFAVGAVGVVERAVAAARGGAGPSRVALAAGVLVVAASLVTWPTRLLAASHRYAWNCQNVEEMQVALGRWVRAHSRAGDVVASGDAGAVRYFGHRPVIDMMGLNHHDVLDRGVFAVMQEAAPRYVLYFPVKYPRLAESPEFRVVHRVRSPRYTIFKGRQDETVVLERR